MPRPRFTALDPAKRRAILDAAAELTSATRLAELAERTLASAKSECAIWGFRDVARIRITNRHILAIRSNK